MQRVLLVLLGAILIVAGTFPASLQEQHGSTFTLGLRSSPLAHFRTTEVDEVDANGSRHHELTRDWAFEFLSLSTGLVVAGIFLVVRGASRMRATTPPAA